MKNNAQKKIFNQMLLVDSKDFLFDIIKSEFIEKIFPIEITFEKYAIYITTLKDEIIYSTECVDFYSNFMNYQNNYPNDYTKNFKFSVFKYKLDNEDNKIPTIYEFRSYMKNVKHNDQIGKSNNDENNNNKNCKSTAIIPYISKTSVKIKKDKRCKLKNEDEKRIWDFNKFPY